MSDYVVKYKCGSCRNYEYEGKDTKGYCSYYRSYYYPDDSCSHWDQSNTCESSTGCFLTTACCEYKGLPDDCEELTVMRAFRDNYLSKTPVGRRCIQIYYEEAPRIVNQIEKSPFRDKILEEIYQEVCELKKMIEKGKNEDVLSRYLLLMMQVDEKSRAVQEEINSD